VTENSRVRGYFTVQIIATIAVVFVAVIHIFISVVEILLWEKPLVHQRLGFTADVANQVAPIVKNAGLYNSFIAAGLIWGAFTTSNFLSIRVFFLVCVVIAGIFGALTLKRTTLVLQTIPASIALLFVWLAFIQTKG
jgi:putative membrane protein